MKFSATIVIGLCTIPAASAWEESCTQFKNIYADGTQLCEVMWEDSFTVVDDESMGYTMWFFDHDTNPNNEVTAKIHGNSSTPDKCHLNYFHKEIPSPEDDNMSECHPWQNNACCNSDTVESGSALNAAYGPGFEWDRCGPMSQACERFFVQEACLYECEPSAGLYRKFKEDQFDDPDYNEWQLFKMPIKKSYCNAWYDACKNDYFCGKGSFFECSAFYWEDQKAKEEAAAAAAAAAYEEEGPSSGVVIGLSVAGALAVAGILASVVLISREKSGNPMFAPAETGVST
ncbi:unnamed protein product [Cylindrotheca closterium]|uniref:Folate receptor-like domain-containing protein n=1 Tax=Cylindrotheca closterium TaxID=2856 RepID=A0AAD2FYN9_9STRA|nr:unnamed protein product [Cylindrotheca closterium]CAJ1956813.1 unnamed protein product [Cylindrotheca closterium]